MNWIQVPAEKLMHPHLERVRNVEVQVFVAPHDIPQRVRGEFDRAKNLFVIEFQYLDQDEFVIANPSDDGLITAFTGGSSGRIGRIEVDVRKMAASSVSLNIQAVSAAEAFLRLLATRKTSLASRLNSQAASEAIHLSIPALMTSMAPLLSVAR